MKFYLGTHQPHWLGLPEFRGIPLFVSRRRLDSYKRVPRAATAWALDSGGFTELAMHGGWEMPAAEYAALVRRYADQVGRLEWAAPQDWMCEPVVRERTGLDVTTHIDRTVANFAELRGLLGELVIPVLQGWDRADYERCADSYAVAGFELSKEPRVGLGTICRRQGTQEAAEIVEAFAGRGVRLHAFGAKITGLRLYGDMVASADSLAWSFAARRQPPLPGCVGHKNCANCSVFARRWRDKIVSEHETEDNEKPPEAEYERHAEEVLAELGDWPDDDEVTMSVGALRELIRRATSATSMV